MGEQEVAQAETCVYTKVDCRAGKVEDFCYDGENARWA
jgi:hypothetical protein